MHVHVHATCASGPGVEGPYYPKRDYRGEEGPWMGGRGGGGWREDRYVADSADDAERIHCSVRGLKLFLPPFK